VIKLAPADVDETINTDEKLLVVTR